MNLAGAAGGASDALTQLLTQEFAKRQQLAAAARADQELALQKQTHADSVAFRNQDTKNDAAKIRASLLSPGVELGQGDVSALQGTPYEALLDTKQTLPSTSRVMPESAPQANAGGRPFVSLRPTSQQMQAAGQKEGQRRLVDLFKRGAPRNEVLGAMAESGQDITGAMLTDPAATAAANREAANERASAERQMRLTIAGMANQGRSETTGLRNELLQSQIEAAHQKASDTAATTKRARDAARQTAGDTVDVLKKLATFGPDGKASLNQAAASLFGAGTGRLTQYYPGSDAANASAALERLKGRSIVDLLAEMKSQSRTGATGFGALNERELSVLENSANQLGSRNISPERAAEELARIYAIANRALGDEQVNVQPPPGAPSAKDLILKYGGGNGR